MAIPSRDIVRAIIAAATGVANDVPSQAAQPSNAIGALSATFVVARANVDCRFVPRVVASTHQPWLLYGAAPDAAGLFD